MLKFPTIKALSIVCLLLHSSTLVYANNPAIPLMVDTDGDLTFDRVDTDDDNDGTDDNDDFEPLNNAITTASPQSTQVNASQDAHIRSVQGATNYGSDVDSQTKNGNRKTLLKFNIPDLGNISSADLYIHSVDENDPLSIYNVDDNTWSENTVTWDTAPTIGTTLLGTLTASPAAYTSTTLSTAPANNTPVNYSVEDSSDPTNATETISMKESGNPPYLDITYTPNVPLRLIPNVSTTARIDETGTATVIGFTLASAPTDSVYVPLTPSNPAVASVDIDLLTFTPGNWNVEQFVTYTGISDAATSPAQTADLHIYPLHSNDANFNGNNPDDLSFTTETMRVDNFNAPTINVGDSYSLDLTYTSIQPTSNVNFSVISAPVGLHVTEGAGRVTWRPTTNQTGTHNVILQLVDDNGGFALHYTTITVNASAVPDPTGLYVVINSGLDDPSAGSVTNPYDTIEYALTQATPGDFVYVRGGRYVENDINVNAVGTAGNVITVTPLPGENVSLDFTGNNGFDINSPARYIVIDGFEIDGGTDANDHWQVLALHWWKAIGQPPGGGQGIDCDGQYITIKNCVIHDCYQKGINVKEGRYVTMLNNVIYKIGWNSLTGGHGIMRKWEWNFGTADDVGVYRWDIYGNLIFGVEQRIYSWVIANEYSNLVLDEGKPILIDRTTDNNIMTRIAHNVVAFGSIDHIRLKRTPNMEVYNNSVYTKQGESHADGITETEANPNLKVYNNAVHSGTGSNSFGINKTFLPAVDYSPDVQNNYHTGGGSNQGPIMGITDNDPAALFNDPTNGDFSLDAGAPPGIGADPAQLAIMDAHTAKWGYNIAEPVWYHDHKRMTQTIVDNVPTDRFINKTYAASVKEAAGGRMSFWYDVTPAWQAFYGYPGNQFELVLPEDYRTWYDTHSRDYGSRTIGGDYTMSGGDDLYMQIGGYAEHTDYHRLSVNGTATLNGTLDVYWANAFTPVLNDEFILVSAASVTGSFTTTNLPALPGGLQWQEIQTATEYKLKVVATGGNNFPTFTTDPFSKADATEAAAYTGQTISGSATDADPDTLTYSKVSGPAWLLVATDGTLTGTPGNADVGVNAFVVRVDDGNGGTDDATLNITVINVNQQPVFTSDPVNKADAGEGAAYSGQSLAGSATDGDGDTLTYTKTGGPAWLTIAPGGSLSGTPGGGDIGGNVFTVQVSDGALTDTATLNITVTANTAPTFTSDPISKIDAYANSAYVDSLNGEATDADGDTLVYTKTAGPAWLVISPGGGLSGTPTPGDLGLNIFTIQVSDGRGGTDSATLNITVNSGYTDWAFPYDGTETSDVLVWHMDDDEIGGATNQIIFRGDTATTPTGKFGQGLTSNGNVGLTNDGFKIKDSDIAGTTFPSGADPSLTVEMWINFNDLSVDQTLFDKQDGLGNVFKLEYDTGTDKIIWDVGDPVNTGGNRVSVTPSNLLTGQWYHIAGTWDAASDMLRLFVNGVEVGSSNAPGITLADLNNQFFIGGSGGTTNFDATVDELRISDRAIPFVPLNPGAPIWYSNPIAMPTAQANLAYSETITECIHVVDPEGDAMTFSKISGPAWLSVAAGGALSGTPTDSDSGNNSFVVRADDGNGNTTDVTMDIFVQGVVINWRTPYTGQSPNTIHVWHMDDSEIGAGAGELWLQDDAVANPTGGSPQILGTNGFGQSIDGNGAVGLTGDKVKVRQSDAIGVYFPSAANPSFTVEAWVRIDDKTTDHIEIVEKQNGTADVFRLRYMNQDRLRWEVGDPFNSDNNRLDVNTPGIVLGQWHHVAGTWDYGTQTLKLYLDGVEIGSQATTSGTLDVVDSNSEIFFGSGGNPLNGSIDEVRISDTALVFAVPNTNPVWAYNPIIKSMAQAGSAYSDSVTDNIDVRDPEDAALTFSKISGPAWASVSGAGAITGTPASGDAGVNNIVIRASDGTNASDTTIQITVNVAPVFTADPTVKAQAIENIAYSGQSLSGAATDGNGHTLTYTKVSGPAWLTIATNGDLSGTPTGADLDLNAWTVQADDGYGGVTTATLNITVNALPVFTSDPIAKANATESTAYTGQTLNGEASDDNAGDTLTYSKVSGPAWLSIAANGALSGTPAPADVGANAWTVQVDDGNGAIDTATLNITVDSASTPYDSWETANGIAGSGRATDADGDGFTNEYEYFFGYDPTSNVNPRQPDTGTNTNAPTITYTYRTDDPAITYTLETSTNLSTWSTASATTISGPTANGDGTSTITVRSDTNFATQPKQFFRIKAEE